MTAFRGAGKRSCNNHELFEEAEMTRKLRILAIASLALSVMSAQPLLAQVNMQYNGQYSGQYRGQFNGQYSGKYYGGDQTGLPNRRGKNDDPLGYPVNSGSCGELYYPQPGTDYIVHDRQGKRCY
jgi:hypothetical protein